MYDDTDELYELNVLTYGESDVTNKTAPDAAMEAPAGALIQTPGGLNPMTYPTHFTGGGIFAALVQRWRRRQAIRATLRHCPPPTADHYADALTLARTRKASWRL